MTMVIETSAVSCFGVSITAILPSQSFRLSNLSKSNSSQNQQFLSKLMVHTKRDDFVLFLEAISLFNACFSCRI